MPVVVDGAVVVRNRLHLRYSFDERIDDGMNANDGVIAINHVLENPFAMLGCLAADGSDRRVLKGRAHEV
jgi:pyruvate/2-oxoglutarate dehydrogenase complex dihydrolipoamide acyltransferase (E2) component